MNVKSPDEIGYEIALSEKWGGFDCTSEEINKLAAMISKAISQERASKPTLVLPDDNCIDDLATKFASTPIKDGLFVTSIDMDVAYVAASFGRLLRDHIKKQCEGEK